jgi:hypothetical protein
MLQAFVDTDRDLGRESVSASEYRRTDDSGESGIDQDLAAHDDEAPIKLRILTGKIIGMMNAINFASSHFFNLCRRLSFGILIPKNVFDLGIQLCCGLIDEFEIASFELRPRPFPKVLREHGLDEGGARLLRSGNAIDAGKHLF